MLKVGPFPSPNSEEFPQASAGNETIHWDEKGKNKIAQMFISYTNEKISSLAFLYIDVEDGKLTLSPTFGSQNFDSPNFDTVTFMEGSDKEYITKVSGLYGRRGTMRGLVSLTIETNEATYGPFGREPATTSDHNNFNIKLGVGDQFGGFHGTSSSQIITSIGVYVKPLQHLNTNFKKTSICVD